MSEAETQTNRAGRLTQTEGTKENAMLDTYTEEQWARDGGAMPNAQDRWTPMGRIYWCAIAREIQEREQYDSETALAQRLAQEDGRDEPNDLDIAAAEWAFELLYPES